MYIEQLKFKSDNYHEYKNLLAKSDFADIGHRFQLLSSSLKISEEITPSIFRVVSLIETKLQISNLKIEYYIENNPDINASCFSLNNDVNLIVVLTSGLINIMDSSELSFVIGHEIGHYLFGHLKYKKSTENLNLIKYYQATEISADRVGLICSDNIQSAIKAIVKTISGLDDRFISDKLYTFIYQHNALDTQQSYISNSTHPTLPTRAKALILFSMSELYYNWIGKQKQAPITVGKLEKTVEGYLYNTSLKQLQNENSQILSKLKMWLMVKIFIDSNHFENFEFNILEKEIGTEKKEKIRNYLKSHSTKGINSKIEKLLIEYQFLAQNEKQLFREELESIFKIFGEKYQYQKVLGLLFR